jgi:hypothetical protein
VLNAAVSAQKPVLAFSGSGLLKKVVEKYHLGVFVEPDDSGEILSVAQILLDLLLTLTTQNLDTRSPLLTSYTPLPPLTGNAMKLRIHGKKCIKCFRKS